MYPINRFMISLDQFIQIHWFVNTKLCYLELDTGHNLAFIVTYRSYLHVGIIINVTFSIVDAMYRLIVRKRPKIRISPKCGLKLDKISYILCMILYIISYACVYMSKIFRIFFRKIQNMVALYKLSSVMSNLC